MVKIIIFGAGVGGKKTLENLSVNDLILCFVDNDSKKHGTEICGYKVCKPSDILTMDYDYILIGSMYHKDIKNQLIGMGVTERRIVVDPELILGANESVSWGCFIVFLVFLFLILVLVGISLWFLF